MNKLILLAQNVVLGSGWTPNGNVNVNDVKNKVTEVVDLIIWGVMIAGVLATIKGVVDLKEATTTEGAPAQKKKVAVLEIVFGALMAGITGVLKFLGVIV